ncbi:MAG: cyclic-di-AMP receptor [Clostridia bacterium]|nr:cyclic-di-AMP receptor [Clostridia bacterium]
MKLILAIVNNDDSNVVISALTNRGFEVTRLSTTGGFLNVGNTTLLIGTDEDRIDDAIELLKIFSSTRRSVKSSRESFGRGLRNDSVAEEVTVGGATYFILNVEEHGRI